MSAEQYVEQTGDGREPELRLAVSAAAAAEFLADPRFFPKPPTEAEQVTSFLDTPRHELRRAGFSLRVLEGARRRMLRLRAETHVARRSLGHSEWHYGFVGDTPSIDQASANIFKSLTGVASAALEPAFALHLLRASGAVERESAQIAITVARGCAVAGARERAVNEIVLRLDRGDMRDLYALAREVREAVPASLGAGSDSEHGLSLGGKEPARILTGIAFGNDLLAEECFAAMVETSLRDLRVGRDLIGLGTADEATGRLASAIRILRLTLAMFAEMLDGPDLDRIRFELHWLGSSLVELHNAEAVIARVGMDQQAQGDGERNRRLRALLDNRRARDLAFDLAEWVAVGEWRTSNAAAVHRLKPFDEFAPEGLARLRNQVKEWTRNRLMMVAAERQQTLAAGKRLRLAGEILVRPEHRRRPEIFPNALDGLEIALGEISQALGVNAGLGELVMIDGRSPFPVRRRGGRTPRSPSGDPIG